MERETEKKMIGVKKWRKQKHIRLIVPGSLSAGVLQHEELDSCLGTSVRWRNIQFLYSCEKGHLYFSISANFHVTYWLATSWVMVECSSPCGIPDEQYCMLGGISSVPQ